MAGTKHLFLLRHAKSSWDDPVLEDHDRPLAPRGRRAAALIAEHLRREGIGPALILCSSALRARETLSRAVQSGTPAEVRIERNLYAASAAELIERLRRVPPATRSVMLIGHNPALQTLVCTLAEHEGTRGQASAGGLLAAAQGKFPTGALATLALACRWRELGPGSAELTGFVRPRDLE